MIIQPVPRDIREFKPKFIGPFTKPQAISVAISALIAFIIFSVFKGVSTEILMFTVAIIDAPILACGFINYRNMSGAVYFRDVILRNMLVPKKRPYKTENAYQELSKRDTITYEYFDPDFGFTTNKKGERVKVKNRQKCADEKLKAYLKAHPEMAGME